MKSICIAGKNDIATDVLLYCKEHFPEHRLYLICNRAETGINSWQRSVKWFADKNNIQTIRLEDVYEMDDLLFLSLEFDRILKPDKFRTKELYNVHFSMLPKYKGVFPSILPILYGDESTGVSLHRINAGIDTGEIIAQKEIIIDENDTSFDLYQRLMYYGTKIVIEYLSDLISGNVQLTKQSAKNSTYFSKDTIDFSNITLNVRNTAFQIKNQIRAFCFRPYQLLSWNDSRYVECKILEKPSEKAPGTILEDNEIYTIISTIDYDALLYKDTFDEASCIIADGNNACWLCESKKIIQAKNDKGWSLLTIAVYNNNFSMVKSLVEMGADINVVNNNGTTLLMYAKDCFVNYNDATIFEYLIDLGLNISQMDYYGKTLKDYCEIEEITKIGKIDLHAI